MNLSQISVGKDLPDLKINRKTGSIKFSGSSTIESLSSFESILDDVRKYIKKAPKETTINFEMDYFNTSTSKAMMDVFVLFQNLAESGKNVKVKWAYKEKDLDMKDAGELYEEITDLPFEFKLLD